MSTFKKTKVVLLTTNEKASSLSVLNSGKLNYGAEAMSSINTKLQHLYFLSDEEIKEGDWILHKNTIYQVRMNKGLYLTLEGLQHIDVRSDLCKKIIATTDKSLKVFIHTTMAIDMDDCYESLPQPSQSFIEKFVEEYNKGNVITEVMVEYEDYDWGLTVRDNFVTYQRLKINPKDNTITIRKAKDSWSREEVISILDSHADFIDDLYRPYHRNNILGSESNKKWIEENL